MNIPFINKKEKERQIVGTDVPTSEPAAATPTNLTSEHTVDEPGSFPPISVPAMPQPAQSNDLTQEKLDQFLRPLVQFLDVAKSDLRQETRAHHDGVKTLLQQEVQIQGKLDDFQGQLDQFIERAKNDLSETASIFTRTIKGELLVETKNFKTTFENKLDGGFTKLDEDFTKLSEDHLKKLDGAIRIYTEEKENCEALAKKIKDDGSKLEEKEKALKAREVDYDTKESTLDDREKNLIKADQQVRDAKKDIQDREEKAEYLKKSAKEEFDKAKKIKDDAAALREESLKISDECTPDFLAETSLMHTQVLKSKEDEDETRNMLIAHLHLLSRTFGFAEEDGSSLKKNLSDTGRFLFRFLKQRDLTSEDAIEWRDIINGKLTDQDVDVELRIPEIGEPYEQKWMQVSGSSKGDRVEQVVNWGVMTREGIRIHKAEVEV